MQDIRFLEIKTRCRDWLVEKMQGTHAKIWLAIISFTESWIFPIPTVVFIIALVMAEARRWVYIAGFATLFSVLGGLAGYLLGAFFFDTIGQNIVHFYHLEAEVVQVEHIYNTYAFWAVLIGAFTPLPFKLFTLSAGFLKINIIAFLFASFLGRALQFFIVAYVVKIFGGRVAKIIFDYFGIITLIAVAILVFILVL